MTEKVIAITGASSGIGEATARLLAGTGAKMVLGARRVDRLAAVASAIHDEGGKAVSTELDVTSLNSMQAFADFALDQFGRIDVMVNNAGIMMLSPLAELRIDEWNKMIDVNLRGVLHGVAAVLPHMMKQEKGHIIIVGSTSGRRVAPTNAVYAATKHAVRAIAEGIRIEGRNSIRSTIISAGMVDTELLDHISDPMMRDVIRSRSKDALPAISIARAIAHTIDQADDADVSEIIIRPPNIKE